LQKLQESLFHEKETLIENCPFGVDVNPNSVNICRLRLWIELLKNAYYTKESDYKELETLPNIDINIKQGNSLISRFDLREDIFRNRDRTFFELYKINVQIYKNTADKNDRINLKKAIEQTKDKLKGVYFDPLNEDRKKLKKLNAELFDLTNQLTSEDDEIVKLKKQKLDDKIQKLAEKIINKEDADLILYKDAFEWRFEFPEVLDEKGDFLGFDVVIGNPPYGVDFSNSEKKHYKVIFKDVHVRTPESFNYFIKRYISISANQSFCNLIIPSSFLNQIEFEKARKLIIDNYYLFDIMNLGDGVFDDVTTATCILGFAKNCLIQKINYTDLRNTSRKNLSSELTHSDSKISSTDLKNNQSSSFIYRENQSLINKCYKNSSTLKDITEDVATGISSGLDKAYVFTETEIKNKKLEIFLLKKLIIGGEIHRYHLNPRSNKSIIYINDENVITSYPKIEFELEKYKDKLKLRREAANGSINWYSLNWPRRQKLFDHPKILIRQTASNIIAAYDEDKWYCLKSGIIVQLPENSEISYLYLLGLLNSSLMDYLYKDLVNEENRIFPEVKPIQLFKLPIKIGSTKNQLKLEGIIKILISEKQNNLTKDTSKLEAEIDQLVYKLYGLTEEEIKIVEESVKQKN
jgi:adenine-specific DNA-methyltransferase